MSASEAGPSKGRSPSRSSSKDSVSSTLMKRVQEKLQKREARAKEASLLKNAEKILVEANVIPYERTEPSEEYEEISTGDERAEVVKAKLEKGIGKGKSRMSRTKAKKKAVMKKKELKDIEIEQTDSSGSENEFSKEEVASHVSFTLSNPLGKVLLQLVDDNLKLQEKAGITSSAISASKMCSSFYLQMQQEQLKTRLAMEEKARETESKILVRELESVSVTNEEHLPSYFSSKPKLISSQANIEAGRLFPTRTKFSGSNLPDSLSLQEFFQLLKAAQESMRLTEQEFTKMLLLCTSNKAHELLSNWIEQGNDIKTLYFNLTLQFDRRMTVDDARHKLLTIMAPKTTDLAKHCALILQLATRASHCLPAGPSRQSYLNNESINCLQRSLPLASRTLCSNTFHTLSSKARRAITFNELTRSLLTLRSTIDADIRSNGVGTSNSGPPPNNKPQGYNSGKAKRNGKVRTSSNVYSVEVPMYYDEYDLPIQPLPQKKKHTQNKIYQPHAVVYQNVAAQGHSNGNPGTPGTQPSGPRNPNQSNQRMRPKINNNQSQNSRGNKGSRYCSLCGQTTHVAAQGCRNMVDNAGRIVQVQPSQSVCGNCPQTVSPRLNHPPILCPFRIHGPLHGTR
jgi:hypothetical protein